MLVALSLVFDQILSFVWDRGLWDFDGAGRADGSVLGTVDSKGWRLRTIPLL
jgi:hypothetical protein